jgi:methylmalonyl-CoA/ethylmalonyl-CoA epimerase
MRFVQSGRGWRIHSSAMLKIRGVEHVAVAVDDIDAALAKYREVLGLEVTEREYVESQKTETARLPLIGTAIELISPKGNESLARFLERRGPGLHHIAVEVEGIEEALAFLEGLGVPLVDRAPRIGAQGHKVAFLHPKATLGVLIELVDKGHAAT